MKQVPLDNLVPLEQLDYKAHKDHKVLLEPPAPRAYKVPQDLKAK